MPRSSRPKRPIKPRIAAVGDFLYNTDLGKTETATAMHELVRDKIAAPLGIALHHPEKAVAGYFEQAHLETFEQKGKLFSVPMGYQTARGKTKVAPLQVPLKLGPNGRAEFQALVFTDEHENPVLTVTKNMSAEPHVVIAAHNADGHLVAEQLLKKLVGITRQLNKGRVEFTSVKVGKFRTPRRPAAGTVKMLKAEAEHERQRRTNAEGNLHVTQSLRVPRLLRAIDAAKLAEADTLLGEHHRLTIENAEMKRKMALIERAVKVAGLGNRKRVIEIIARALEE